MRLLKTFHIGQSLPARNNYEDLIDRVRTLKKVSTRLSPLKGCVFYGKAFGAFEE
jgi:hypothetical protein